MCINNTIIHTMPSEVNILNLCARRRPSNALHKHLRSNMLQAVVRFLPVYISSVPGSHDAYNQLLILDLIHNPVGSTSEPVFLFSGKFPGLRWSRIFSKISDSLNYSLHVFLRDPIKVFVYRLSDQNSIACHHASVHSRRSRM